MATDVRVFKTIGGRVAFVNKEGLETTLPLVGGLDFHAPPFVPTPMVEVPFHRMWTFSTPKVIDTTCIEVGPRDPGAIAAEVPAPETPPFTRVVVGPHDPRAVGRRLTWVGPRREP